MSLEKFFKKDESLVEVYNKRMAALEKLIEEYKKEGLNLKRAKAKAEMKVFTPDTLEDMKKVFNLQTNMGNRIPIVFFVDNQDQVELVRKFFRLNKFYNIPNSSLLIDILTKLDEAFEEGGSNGTIN